MGDHSNPYVSFLITTSEFVHVISSLAILEKVRSFFKEICVYNNIWFSVKIFTQTKPLGKTT